MKSILNEAAMFLLASKELECKLVTKKNTEQYHIKAGDVKFQVARYTDKGDEEEPYWYGVYYKGHLMEQGKDTKLAYTYAKTIVSAIAERKAKKEFLKLINYKD